MPVQISSRNVTRPEKEPMDHVDRKGNGAGGIGQPVRCDVAMFHVAMTIIVTRKDVFARKESRNHARVVDLAGNRQLKPLPPISDHGTRRHREPQSIEPGMARIASFE